MAAAGFDLARERCELCGRSFKGSSLLRHLRRSHPAYAGGLLLRLVSPLVFLVTLLVLTATRAAQWIYVAATVGCLGMLLAGMLVSRSERRKAGARPTLPLRRLLKEGGLRVVLAVLGIGILAFLAQGK